VYISEAEFSGRRPLGENVDPGAPVARRRRIWIGVSAAAVVVVAMAGLAVPGRQAPAPQEAAAPSAAQPPAPPSAPSARPGAAPESRPPALPQETPRPGDLGQALAHYRAALNEKPADPELLDNVGQILVAMNRPGEAVPFLEKAVEAEPFSITARFDLAGAYARSGMQKEAVEQYEALLQAGVSDVRVNHNLGLALRHLGRHGEAAAAFERATALEPGQAPGWLGLALSLEADGRAGEAADALERYLALEPTAPDADNVRARLSRLRSAAEPAAPPPDVANGTPRRRP
jgi:tetratricopeptide (TPR) repeat protein